MAQSKYSKDPGPKTKKLSQSERKSVVPRDQYPEGLKPVDGYDVIMTPMQRWNAEHLAEGMVPTKPGFQSTDPYSKYENQRQQDGIEYQKDPLHPSIQKAGSFENEMHNMYILDNDLAGVQTFNDKQGQSMGNNGYYYRQNPGVKDAAQVALQKKTPPASTPSAPVKQPAWEMRPYYATYNKPGTAGYKQATSIVSRHREGGIIGGPMKSKFSC